VTCERIEAGDDVPVCRRQASWYNRAANVSALTELARRAEALLRRQKEINGGTLLAFLLDNTVANSELIRIVSTSVEAGNDHINILDGVKRQYRFPFLEDH
jgi:hypothetical protein